MVSDFAAPLACSVIARALAESVLVFCFRVPWRIGLAGVISLWGCLPARTLLFAAACPGRSARAAVLREQLSVPTDLRSSVAMGKSRRKNKEKERGKGAKEENARGQGEHKAQGSTAQATRKHKEEQEEEEEE